MMKAVIKKQAHHSNDKIAVNCITAFGKMYNLNLGSRQYRTIPIW